MFKLLSAKTENPGFPDAVILTNKSEHWVFIDDEGRRVPPRTHFALSAEKASSNTLAELIQSGAIVVQGGVAAQHEPRSRKRKKQPESSVEVASDTTEQIGAVDTLVEPESEQVNEVVANSEPENWVSSNENKVGEPTPEQI